MSQSKTSAMLIITLFVLCAGSALAEFRAYDLERADHLFMKFMSDHNKNYQSHHERELRLKIFMENLHEINNYNRKHNDSIMGINRFSDLTKEEFKNTYLGCSIPMDVSNCTRAQVNKRFPHYKAPASFDWREHGVVTPVKDQGKCGSCWAFSTIGNIESQYAYKHNELLDLSEQQEVDCDSSNAGCRGGSTNNAILNLMDKGGVMLEKDYPYTHKDGVCVFDVNKVQVKVTGCLDFSGADEETIKEILVNYGPLTIALGGDPMQMYTRGVLSTCDTQIDHALLVVGYGTDEETGKPYWIIKNSWSESWGENGYIRLIMGNPECEFGKYMLVTSQVA